MNFQNICMFPTVPHGFQPEDYHLSVEDPDHKRNPGKLRAGFYIVIGPNPGVE